MAVQSKKEGLRRAQFGIFEADLEAEELRRSGTRVRLQSQPFKLLATLLEHPGEVVSREALQQELWGADTTVDFDHGLGIAVNKLARGIGRLSRQSSLCGDAGQARLPLHCAGHGPRSAAARLGTPVAGSRPARTPDPPPPGGWPGRWLWFACVLILILVLRPPVRTPYRVAQVTYSGHVLTNDLDVESFSSSASDGTRIYFSHMDNGTRCWRWRWRPTARSATSICPRRSALR